MLVTTLSLALSLALGLDSLVDEIEAEAAIDLRAESRVRPAGQASPDSFAAGEVELMAGASAGFRLDPVSFSLRYGPSLTFTSYDPLSDPLLLHQGSGRVLIGIGSDLRISAAHLRQHGERNFSAALVHEEEGGRRLRLEFLPDVERLPISGHFSLGGLIWNPSRRQEYRLMGNYSSFGGRGEAARRRLPEQSGPGLAFEAAMGFSARNAVLLQARASRTSFDPGPTFRIGELEGGWRHQYDRRTEISGLVGVFAGYNEEPLGSELRSVVLPTLRAELTREQRRLGPEGLLEVFVAATPRINQLEATLDPRVSAEAGLDWSWKESLEGRLDLGHAWVLDEDFSLSGQILAMGGSAALPLNDLLEIEAGMRLFRQRVRLGIDWWGPAGWYWDVFLAVSFRNDFLERR